MAAAYSGKPYVSGSAGLQASTESPEYLAIFSVNEPASLARMAERLPLYAAATDVGMHGLLASQSCYHSVLPPCWCTLLASSRFPYCCPSLHPFGFVRNLFLYLFVYFFLTWITVDV